MFDELIGYALDGVTTIIIAGVWILLSCDKTVVFAS